VLLERISNNEETKMAIFTHVTIGTNDLDKARSFYDSVLEPLGIKRIGDMDNGSMWGVDSPEFMVLNPRDGDPACKGNGSTIGFRAQNAAAIQEFYRRAMAAGATDAGEPGPRTFAPNAYAGYVLDLDGNKILASCITE
jgi:catechol 2,3-dioxygenase-like lactoylglutathione lyase family enzyme